MAKFTGVNYDKEYQVQRPATLAGFEEHFPFGRIGEEVLPSGLTDWRSYEERVVADGMRYLRFPRPISDDILRGTILTDSENGMWIPTRLLEKCLK